MYVVMALVLLLGINAYFNMPREEYPEIKENIVFISSIYPGNTAEDVEKLITEPLEDKLKSKKFYDVCRFLTFNSFFI